MELLPGTYNYNFEAIVPPDLPTSYEGEDGQIRYTIRVGIESTLWPDNTSEELFTVIRSNDLDANPALSVIFFFYFLTS